MTAKRVADDASSKHIFPANPHAAETGCRVRNKKTRTEMADVISLLGTYDAVSQPRSMSHPPRPQHLSLPSLLDTIQRQHAAYFWDGADTATGLPYDRRGTKGEKISDLVSLGGVGFGLMSIIVMADRGWVARHHAASRVFAILDALAGMPRYRGAFPHFVKASDLTVVPLVPLDDGADLIETALLAQGLLCAREYFDEKSPAEDEIREQIHRILTAIEWSGFVRPGARPSLFWHWSPQYEWSLNVPITGWNEGLIAYVLAAGSQDHSIDPEVFHLGWKNEGAYRNGESYYGHTLPAGSPYGGPLFLSQYSFCGLDPRGLFDEHIDYWDQAVAHSGINYEHCRRNPKGHIGYGVYGWGLTASDGPRGYLVSCPMNDVGVLAPTAALSSFPFLPAQAEAAARAFLSYGNGRLWGAFGFADAFAPAENWVSDCHLAINQGPMVAMIENYRTGLLWRLFMKAPEVMVGLARLGIDRRQRSQDPESLGETRP
ncbi:glucoamylase family protein [Rhizobium sp. R635]|uniref:glucoamylase family protein n=1 Tax=unclassified Rhizobium TaxID=2613769 RepID=UPI0026D289C9